MKGGKYILHATGPKIKEFWNFSWVFGPLHDVQDRYYYYIVFHPSYLFHSISLVEILMFRQNYNFKFGIDCLYSGSNMLMLWSDVYFIVSFEIPTTWFQSHSQQQSTSNENTIKSIRIFQFQWMIEANSFSGNAIPSLHRLCMILSANFTALLVCVYWVLKGI